MGFGKQIVITIRKQILLYHIAACININNILLNDFTYNTLVNYTILLLLFCYVFLRLSYYQMLILYFARCFANIFAALQQCKDTSPSSVVKQKKRSICKRRRKHEIISCLPFSLPILTPISYFIAFHRQKPTIAGFVSLTYLIL